MPSRVHYVVVFLLTWCQAVFATANSEWHQKIPMINPDSSVAQAMQVLGTNNLGVIQTHFSSLESKTDKATTADKWIHAFTVIAAPLQQVQNRLLDFSRYKDMMPHVIDSRISEIHSTHWIAEYKLSFKMPVVHVKPKVTMLHRLLPNGDLVEQAVKGDLEFSQARWQLIPLSPKRTLVIQTSAADIGSASWWLKLMFYVQPDLELLSPINAAALTLQSLRQAVERKFLHRVIRIKSDNCDKSELQQLLPDFNKAQQRAIGELTSIGPVSMAGAHTVLSYFKKRLVLQAVTTARMVPKPKPQLIDYYSDIRHYPKHMKAIRRIDKVKEKALQHHSQWQLGFDFAVFTFKVNFAVNGTWKSERDEFNFHSPEGDFHYLNGRLQAWQHEENATIVLFSSAHEIDPNAGYILKAISGIPFNQLFSGIFIGRQLIDGQAAMLNDRSN